MGKVLIGYQNSSDTGPILSFHKYFELDMELANNKEKHHDSPEEWPKCEYSFLFLSTTESVRLCYTNRNVVYDVLYMYTYAFTRCGKHFD